MGGGVWRDACRHAGRSEKIAPMDPPAPGRGSRPFSLPPIDRSCVNHARIGRTDTSCYSHPSPSPSPSPSPGRESYVCSYSTFQWLWSTIAYVCAHPILVYIAHCNATGNINFIQIYINYQLINLCLLLLRVQAAVSWWHGNWLFMFDWHSDWFVLIVIVCFKKGIIDI